MGAASESLKKLDYVEYLVDFFAYSSDKETFLQREWY